MRTILTFIVFFAAGLAVSAGYFYGRHPEHSPIDDVPQLRRDVEGMIERGRKLREAWKVKPAQPQPEPAATEAAPVIKPEETPLEIITTKPPTPPTKTPREKTKKKSVEK